ncbi:protein FAR1-RELATED SEQUENCE 2-like [Impatiens glandulifera]|uniref:protein FAR1-RELATED SEQUENCE 2-like n=1 Tax=Impatiens glandulifera TaxID=253017 RepID=UPI001FB18DD4|nr:protein FAR1-RELATED SEQUENCE 2-like [Impatiens glandulifera]
MLMVCNGISLRNISMDIDLEQPSGLEEKLNANLNTSVKVMTRIPSLERVACGKSIIGSQDANNAYSNEQMRNLEPQIGMEFETKEAAYCFYREYARSFGFGITIKASRRSKKSGKFIDVKVACSRFGSKRESNTSVNPRSCPKTGCKASMQMKRRQDGKWFIYGYTNEHNHEICPDDFQFNVKGRNKPDLKLSQKKGLQLALDEEDVQILLDYFVSMQAENPNFFYAVDLDGESRMENVLWIDAKTRHDYKYFSDVVFFDTTYVKDRRYKVPIIPIFGVNHHLHLMLLGCALVGEETTSTFVWLMRTWLRAVGGQTPSVVLTDEGKLLEDAVVEVFPKARHCFCLWHVLEKVSNNSENFLMEFTECINESWSENEFEISWFNMVHKFGLQDNTWFESIYGNRRKWVPAYMNEVFFGGISTADQTESVTSIFTGYIHKESTFKEFIEQYKLLLDTIYKEENEADSTSSLKSVSPLEKQMSTLYTHTVFKKFQEEVLGIDACSVHKECEDDETSVTFRVNDFEKRRNFIVSWNDTESRIFCLCRTFQYKGFLCRHSIAVLQMLNISSVPLRYILKRWTRGAKNGQTMSKTIQSSSRVQRFNDLCKRAVKLGEEGSLSEESFDIILNILDEATERCVVMNRSVRSSLDPIPLPTRCSPNDEGNSTGKSLTKKNKRRVRKKQQEHLNSEATCLDHVYVPQMVQGTEIGSRISAPDVYYDAQQLLHEAGQLNFMSSACDGVYRNQQDILPLVCSKPMSI